MSELNHVAWAFENWSDPSTFALAQIIVKESFQPKVNDIVIRLVIQK